MEERQVLSWQGGWLPEPILYDDPEVRRGWEWGGQYEPGPSGNSLPPAQVAEGPRLAWSQGRSGVRAPPSRPPKPSHFLCAAVRELELRAVQAQDARELRLSLWLSAPRPSRHPPARSGPWICPGASWWPGLSASGQVRVPS